MAILVFSWSVCSLCVNLACLLIFFSFFVVYLRLRTGLTSIFLGVVDGNVIYANDPDSILVSQFINEINPFLLLTCGKRGGIALTLRGNTKMQGKCALAIISIAVELFPFLNSKYTPYLQLRSILPTFSTTNILSQLYTGR